MEQSDAESQPVPRETLLESLASGPSTRHSFTLLTSLSYEAVLRESAEKSAEFGEYLIDGRLKVGDLPIRHQVVRLRRDKRMRHLAECPQPTHICGRTDLLLLPRAKPCFQNPTGPWSVGHQHSETGPYLRRPTSKDPDPPRDPPLCPTLQLPRSAAHFPRCQVVRASGVTTW